MSTVHGSWNAPKFEEIMNRLENSLMILPSMILPIAMRPLAIAPQTAIPSISHSTVQRFNAPKLSSFEFASNFDLRTSNFPPPLRFGGLGTTLLHE
jgi:hypothetical protein